MRRWALPGGVLLALALGAVALGEGSGEVVVLHTTDAAGATHGTRLWIVEHDGSLWLRAGARAVGSRGSWYARLRAQPVVELERGGRRHTLRALPEPAARAAVNARMREAYGLADHVIATFRDPASSMPVRLASVDSP